ncbi:hypothetical protein TpMuguga_01g01080 [Theileria parva strain Muguga]|uniref:Uncharacterized protein n=1 Tax=Theileria parva TaxID=5875 RepID=Q4N6U0_THEPA|nr:uncharacterized protein TpMuguga_01g01080 [Theileria parva strain Muguga]EAN34318.1 hypothetical protein TpMuguga_01g01080 [Theileria parva strain Muguga]|eukprot:XP_766601.1 hypothetical protein [Theileria parva strain Muguga]
MKLCLSIFFIIFLNSVSSRCKILLNSGLDTSQYCQDSRNMDNQILDSNQSVSGKSNLPQITNTILHIDFKLCSYVFGTYLCQALFLNGMFVLLANLSQRIQNDLGIDTSSILSGRISGVMTVTVGSYVSYKLSEFLLDIILSLFRANAVVSKLKGIINPSNTKLSCINVPLFIFYKCSKYLHNQIPLGMGSLDIYVKNKILNRDKKDDEINGDVQISVKAKKEVKNKLMREFTVISTYSLATFLILGGKLHSFTPSELSHPGAFSIPKLSLEADGYSYATKSQRNIIQILGRKYGCHTCGLISDSERYIADHQPPSGVIKRRLKGKYISFLLRNYLIPIQLVKPKQHFYPQCNKCSLKQSKAVANNKRVSITHYGRLRSYHLCPTTFFVSRVIFDTKWSRLNRKVK